MRKAFYSSAVLRKSFLLCLACIGGISVCASTIKEDKPKKKSVSGVYPELGYYNQEGECGTGAVVPWADKLWVITYGPHLPFGSSDKLIEITSDLNKRVYPESIGGTPANRLIHAESKQLFIGPYAIDSAGRVRVIPLKDAPGRFTGIARSVSDPQNKVVIATMEEGFYEIDVHTLKVNTWFKDGNVLAREGAGSYQSELLPGAHGKGLYAGQGVYVYSNNGEPVAEALVNPRIEAGVLAEYNGENWKIVRRNQFTEVTGPGGIYGNEHPDTDPIWATGWDYKSILLACRNNDKWTIYRLPKASNSYDGAHGWNTEWPRIRNVGVAGKPEYLMTMHGMFWSFPQTFSSQNSMGILPLGSYLKVIGDFARWNNQLVFGCDDSARSEFLNLRKAKGGIAGPGQSQSNLWFTALDMPSHVGTKDASGSVWQKENVAAGCVSDPYLFAGWSNRVAWAKNENEKEVTLVFEIDKRGNDNWTKLKTVKVEAKSTSQIPFDSKVKGAWIRVRCVEGMAGSVTFIYTDERERSLENSSIFTGLAGIESRDVVSGGLLYALGDNREALGILANETSDGKQNNAGYYELNTKMELAKKQDMYVEDYMQRRLSIPANVVTVHKGSYLLVDDAKRKWRLPLGNDRYEELMKTNALRICREVATERDLFNCGGTFYELPAENADGFAKIRPIATHNFRINDYASYRGMLVMTGIDKSQTGSNKEHVFTSADGKCAVWAGVIDDLWKMGRPVGVGGPWVNEAVSAGVPSDAYLFGYYSNRRMKLSHSSKEPVAFKVEIDPAGDADWMSYKSYSVQPGETLEISLPDNLQGRWIRFVVDRNTEATAWLEYQ